MKKGFTLIELLVVVLIIGILAAVALPQYEKAVEKAHLSEALQNIKYIQTHMDLYILENGGLNSETEVALPDIPSLELSGGTADRTFFNTKHYQYWGGCDSEECSFEVVPLNNAIAYDLYSGRTSSGGWSKICYSESTDMGRYICKSLEGQGWEYIDGDY